MSEIFFYKAGLEGLSMAYPRFYPTWRTRFTHSQEFFDRIVSVEHKVPGVSKVLAEIVTGTSLNYGDVERIRS